MKFLGESSIIVVVGFIISIVAFVIQLIGFSTPFWLKVTFTGLNFNINYGLWQYCLGDVCELWKSDHTDGIILLTTVVAGLKNSVLSDQFDATRALESLALIALSLADAFIVLKLFVLKEIDKLYLVIAGCNIFAGLTAIIGIITYSTIQHVQGGDSATFYFSYAFCIIAAVCAISAGVLIIIGKTKK